MDPSEVEPTEENQQDESVESVEYTDLDEDIEVEQDAPSEIPSSLSDDSTIQISPTQQSLPSDMIDHSDIDPMLFIQLGDHVYIESNKYGKVIGSVYYRSLEFIHVRPIGVSNRIVAFELEQTDEEEKFKEEYGVERAIILQKRAFESFVVQQDFRKGQIIDTFDSNGDAYKRYKITDVDKDNDFIKMAEMDEEKEVIEDTERELSFGYIGIDPSEPFQVISITDYSVKEKEEVPNELNYEVVDSAEEDIEEVLEEEELIEVTGEIEVVLPRILREAASYEQIIPDHIQKTDALNDFISNLDISVQKNTKTIRDQRLLIETLHQLKQESISYYNDGTVRGPKVVSATTLSELIEMSTVPLGRPVLDVMKKGYKFAKDDPEDELQTTDEFTFVEFDKEFDMKLEAYSRIVSTPPQGVGSQLREWVDKSLYFKTYLTPWFPKDMEVPIWSALRDSEFFRTVSPSLYDLSDDSHGLIPSVEGYIASKSEKVAPTFEQIPFGMERALTKSYYKRGDRSRQVFMDEEKASLVSYLLFPLRVAPYVGSKRTLSIAVDSGRSQLPLKTMRTVLEEIGDPKVSGGTSKDIILIDTTAQAYGTILIEDYLTGQTIPALGVGDTYYVLNQYGLDELELNERIMNVLQTKITLYQQQLISTLGEIREKLKNKPVHVPEVNPFLSSPNFLISVKTQPLLLESIENYERINPTMATSDIGVVNHLMKHHNNYFQVTAGNNNYYITKAYYEENNRQFHEQLRINHLLEVNRKQSGRPPKRNECPHVKDMVSVRKIQDDADRFYRMAGVFIKYQGARIDNWFHCNLCKERLLCVHERLQLQAYLKPVEKALIEKEIILSCSGGQFNGKYICRNCGQAMRELDFDNHLEFDDNGKPKSGRAVIEDVDALLEEKIEMLVSAPVELSEQEEMNLDDSEKTCYEVVRELSERVGVQIDRTGFRFIIEHTLQIMSSFPGREIYKKVRLTKPSMPEYDVAYSRKYIGVCAALLLIEIQTKIPSYKIRYSLRGCRSPGFGGYPLIDEKEQKEGIEYLACAISTIHREDGIFFQTKFYSIPDMDERTKGIITYITSELEKNLLKIDVVQAKLSSKRTYMDEIGSSGTIITDTRPHDEIPPSFLPEQIILKPEEAAEEAISPEVVQAMGSRGHSALVKLWIRQAHMIASKNTKLVRGSPLSEVSCCFHPLIGQTDVWFNELPQLGPRGISPYLQGRFMVTKFVPRSAESSVALPNPDVFYRLFLKYCFHGPNMGHPHELGLTNLCTWCGFQFPTHPIMMDTEDQDKEENKGKQAKTAIASQNVDTSNDKFTELLDMIHDYNKVTALKHKELQPVDAIMEQFSSIYPSPIPEWKEVIQTTTQNFIKLPPSADRGDLVQALALVSDATRNAQVVIQNYFPKKGTNEVIHEILHEISSVSWINFFQILQTYFITTFQRLLSNYSETALFIPIELIKELSSIHVNKDLNPTLENELSIVKKYQDNMKKADIEFVRSKMSYCLKQWSALLPYKNIIRSTLIPGRDKALIYIQQLMFYGTLSTLIDPDHIPDEAILQNPIKSSGKSSSKFIIELLVEILKKYSRERISYNEEEIRTQIAIREEKERVHVISEFNKLTEEERQIELINKRLGLGKWAVGGTSLTYKYNSDYYDLERHKREEAGIGSHPDETSHLVAEFGREYDPEGYPEMNEAENEEASGYDHRQDDQDESG